MENIKLSDYIVISDKVTYADKKPKPSDLGNCFDCKKKLDNRAKRCFPCHRKNKLFQWRKRRQEKKNNYEKTGDKVA